MRGAIVVFYVLLSCQAQTLVIPQVADGGGWQTTFVISNMTAGATSASLTFFQETATSATQNWNLPLAESSSPQNLSIPGGGTLFLHTLGTAATTSVGWAHLAGSGISAYAIFTQRVPGRQDQDGTAPAAVSATRILVPFENTSGYATALAVVNSTASNQAISVSIQTDAGVISQPSFAVMPARGHRSFLMADQFPSTAGQRGVAEFHSIGGGLSIIALRFNPTGAFTASPVYPETGQPIIGGSPSTGPLFLELSGIVTFQPTSAPSQRFSISLTPNAGNVTYSARVNGATFLNGTATNQGRTFTFNTIQPNGLFFTTEGTFTSVTAGSLIVTVTPTGGFGKTTLGDVAGSISVTGSRGGPPLTLAGAITGTYSANLP